MEEIINSKEETIFFENDWNQKINNISKKIENKDLEIHLSQNDRFSSSNSSERNQISIIEIILRDIKQIYEKLEIDLAKLQEILFKINGSINFAESSQYQRFLCSKDILCDKSNHKIKRLKKLVSLIEKEDLPLEIQRIIQNIDYFDQELKTLAKETKRSNTFRDRQKKSISI